MQHNFSRWLKMPTATRNRPKTVSVSKTALDQVGSLLLDLSAKPKEEMSLREAIDELREPIQNALAKGYSYEDVVSILGGKGIKTTAATVKRYISLGNPRNRKTRTATTKTKTRRTPAASVEVVESPAPEKAPATPKKTTRTRSAAKPVEPVVLPAKGRRKSAAASVDSAQTKVKTTPKASKTTAAKTARASAKTQASTAKPATRGRKKSG